MRVSPFQIKAEYRPMGDQPAAIAEISNSLSRGTSHHVLLGVTGSGKTFTMANVIANQGKPTLIIAPNKTLAAQLFAEMKELFPDNAVHFFISYYDYYQPEAYLPGSDTYIAKDSSINDDIDKMRHAATQALFERKDVIIVASVSCIYGLGSPETYASMMTKVEVGQELSVAKFLRSLVDIQYTRNDVSVTRGCFRVRGDVVDVLPASDKDRAIRVEFFGDEVERITLFEPDSGHEIRSVESISIYPNSHYVTERNDMSLIVKEILTDLGVRLREFKAQGKLVEYQRLEQRTMQDIELMEHHGFCPGIENYSRYLTGLPPGHPPPTLLDYFPDDFLTIIDESHITVSQVGGMYRGDRSRKQCLVDFGFRLPAALDNRPLNFDEFLERCPQILHVSATPGAFEMENAGDCVTQQIIRPTGLVDPQIVVRPATGQIDDLLAEVHAEVSAGRRVLVTTLTKRMAEDISSYYKDLGIKIAYLHSDIDSIERVELLRELRSGEIDVLVGINLLREGLDLPEVGLVAVMDADKEGFLRSRTSLIQVVGRAARNAEGRVIFYADRTTDSMKACMDETDRRRAIQIDYNQANGIHPETIIKKMRPGLRELYGLESSSDSPGGGHDPETLISKYEIKDSKSLDATIRRLDKVRVKAAGELDFEKAAGLRDELKVLRDMFIRFGDA